MTSGVFLYSHWRKLPINTRHTIATAFAILKRGATEVSNNEVVNDGYKIEDIESALNLDALQKYLNTDETDFLVLWDWLIAATEGRERTMTSTITVATEEEPILTPENGDSGTTITVNDPPESAAVLENTEALKETIKVNPPKKRGRPFKKKP